MKYNYTEDFSTAEKGDILHSCNGDELVIDSIIFKDGRYVPVVAGIEFDDIDLYVTPKYTLIKT